MERREKLAQLSTALIATAKEVKVLSALSWPQGEADAFVASWERGKPALPSPRECSKCGSGVSEALTEIVARCDRGDPVGEYLAQTASSYRRAADLIDHKGTPEFYAISREIYGGADGRLRGSALCHREAAEQLLASTDAMAATAYPAEGAFCISAETVASELAERWEGFFDDAMRFVVDANLSAKAAASATRVRLRAGTCFSEQDIAQLSAHEIGVHSLTSRSGRAQSVVRAMGLGAPRTTATQEGLATFAELVTGAIDLSRLRRIALRIRAIGMVEDGADFVQLFEHLVEIGESPGEAVRTTMRIFRGADLRGRYPFTKDVVYLKGLFSVHTFLRKAIADHRPELIARLFVGRVTLGDVLALEDDFGGIIDDARFTPPWAANLPSLAAFLAFSALIDHIDLNAVDLDEH